MSFKTSTATVRSFREFSSGRTDPLTFAVNPKNGRPSSMISEETYEVVMANTEKLNSAVIYDRDFSYVRPFQLGSF
jgi:hypothetical protein